MSAQRPTEKRFYPYAAWASEYAHKLAIMRLLGFLKEKSK